MSNKKLIENLTEPLDDSGGNGSKFEFSYRRLGPLLDLQKLSCSTYSVPPGKRAFPYHAHSLIEEMFVILEGSGTLRHDDKEYPIRTGDVIAAPLGKAHQIINTSDQELRYLAVSSNEPANVVLYPDSNKVLAYSNTFETTLRHLSKLDDARDYYDGEE